MTRPPFKLWRILHRAKAAQRNRDVETLNRLALMYEKAERVAGRSQERGK